MVQYDCLRQAISELSLKRSQAKDSRVEIGFPSISLPPLGKGVMLGQKLAGAEGPHDLGSGGRGVGVQAGATGRSGEGEAAAGL